MLTVIDTAPFVLDIGVVLLLAAGCGLLARRMGLPAVVGYLAAGVIVSPFTPGYVASHDQVALFADIGVVLLLFEVGIEIDLRRSGREHGSLFWLAPLQVIGTTAIVSTVLGALFDLPLLGAVVVGLGVAMSSSVVVVNITRSRRRTTDPATDDALLQWSVLQDITGVVIAAIVIAVTGTGEQPIWRSLGSLVAFAVLAYVWAQLLPRLLELVRWEQDLFLIFSVASGLTIAAVGTVVFDVPMALAAFVGGLALNHRDDVAEVRRLLLPFRDLFAVLFFVVIGSLVQPTNLMSALSFAIALLLLLVLTKALPIAAMARLTAVRARPAQLAIGLSQMGEFSYVLGALALARGALTQEQFVAVLLVVMVSIVASTVIVRRIAPMPQ